MPVTCLLLVLASFASCPQLPPLHRLDISCVSLPGSVFCLWAGYSKCPMAAVTVSFSQTIYKAPLPLDCLPSLQPLTLGFPLQSPPVPSHRPSVCQLCFSVQGLYLPVIWLLYLSLAAWQPAKSNARDRAEWRGWLLMWLQYGTTTCWICSCFIQWKQVSINKIGPDNCGQQIKTLSVI